MKLAFLFTFLITLSFSKGVDYLAQFETLAKESFQEKYNSEFSLLSKSFSYSVFEQKMQQKKTYFHGAGKSKKSADGLDYGALFTMLEALSKESSSALPSYYAFLLTRLSYGFKNANFNAKYGDKFSLKLSSAGRCEGYLWRGAILQNKKSLWQESAQFYKKAVKVCREGTSYHTQARMEYAKMKYLASSKKKGSK